ncbi:MAG: hypothetical protein MJ016_02675 [Victivallaceae bacterium]|nr:hypothetical protein [Victivallaceae bacterium]
MATAQKKEKNGKPRSPRLKLFLLLAGIALVVAALVFGFLQIRALLFTENPHLALRNVEIRAYSGGYWEKRHDLLIRELKLERGKNIFCFPVREIREKLLRKANLSDAEAEIIFPDTLRLTLSERIPCAHLESGNSIWVADDTGMILQRAETAAEKLSLPVIVESRKIRYAPYYRQREPRKLLLPALRLCSIVQEHFPHLKVKEIRLTGKGSLEAQLSYFNQPVCYVTFRDEGSRQQYIFWVERFLDAINDARRHGDQRNHFDLRFDARINVY